MKLRVRGSKVLLKHTYVPRWFWVVTLLIVWNIVMFSILANVFVMCALALIAIATPLLIYQLVSETYILTDREVVVLRGRKVVKRLLIDVTMVFRIYREKMYYFPPGKVIGDVAISRLGSKEPLVLIKSVPYPRDTLENILREMKRLGRRI